MDLVGRAWDDSFARIGTNKKAVADRGWSPLNYNCLLHPEICGTRKESRQSDELLSNNSGDIEGQDTLPTSTTTAAAGIIASPDNLNLNHGLAGTLVDSIVEVRNRHDARNGINLEENRRKRVQTALDAINSNKRYTAGLHAASGRFLLGPQVLTNFREKKRQQELQESERQEKKIRDFFSLKNKVLTILALDKVHAQLNVTQLRTMVQWFKRAEDLPIPTTRQLLLSRLMETCDRSEPQPPFPQAPEVVAPHLPAPTAATTNQLITPAATL